MLARFLHARAILDKIKIALFSSSENLTEDVKEYIFEYLRRKTLEIIPLLKSENKIQQVEDLEEEVFQQRLDVGFLRNFLKSLTGAGERSQRGTGDFAVQFESSFGLYVLSNGRETIIVVSIVIRSRGNVGGYPC